MSSACYPPTHAALSACANDLDRKVRPEGVDRSSAWVRADTACEDVAQECGEAVTAVMPTGIFPRTGLLERRLIDSRLRSCVPGRTTVSRLSVIG